MSSNACLLSLCVLLSCLPARSSVRLLCCPMCPSAISILGPTSEKMPVFGHLHIHLFPACSCFCLSFCPSSCLRVCSCSYLCLFLLLPFCRFLFLPLCLFFFLSFCLFLFQPCHCMFFVLSLCLLLSLPQCLSILILYVRLTTFPSVPLFLFLPLRLFPC